MNWKVWTWDCRVTSDWLLLHLTHSNCIPLVTILSTYPVHSLSCAWLNSEGWTQTHFLYFSLFRGLAAALCNAHVGSCCAPRSSRLSILHFFFTLTSRRFIYDVLLYFFACCKVVFYVDLRSFLLLISDRICVAPLRNRSSSLPKAEARRSCWCCPTSELAAASCYRVTSTDCYGVRSERKALRPSGFLADQRPTSVDPCNGHVAFACRPSNLIHGFGRWVCVCLCTSVYFSR